MEPEVIKAKTGVISGTAPAVSVEASDPRALEVNSFQEGPVKNAERAIKHDARNALVPLHKLEAAFKDGKFREMYGAMTSVLYGLEILVDNIKHPSNLFGAAVTSNLSEVYAELMNDLRNWIAVFEFVMRNKFPDQTKIEAQRSEFWLFLDSVENYANNLCFVKVFPKKGL